MGSTKGTRRGQMLTSNQRHILVVEDDAKLAQLIATQLQWGGYLVHAESSGLSAIRYATEHFIQLAILDLKLPDISGYEVCEKLRETHTSWTLPILLVTALCEPIDQLHGFACGADAYLTKPFDMTEFLEIVAALFGERTTA